MTDSAVDRLVDDLKGSADAILRITRRVHSIDRDTICLACDGQWSYDRAFLLSAPRAYFVNQLHPLLRARRRLLARIQPPPAGEEAAAEVEKAAVRRR